MLTEVAHWRKKHDDAMWNDEPRDKVQHYWRCFKEFRQLQQEGVRNMFQDFKRPQYQVSRFEVTVVCTECAGHGYVPTPDLNIENLSQVRWSQDDGLSTTGLY